MANSIRVGPDGIEGTNPQDLKRNFVDVDRHLYKAMVDLVTALEHMKLEKRLPAELELPFKRVEKAAE